MNIVKILWQCFKMWYSSFFNEWNTSMLKGIGTFYLLVTYFIFSKKGSKNKVPIGKHRLNTGQFTLLSFIRRPVQVILPKNLRFNHDDSVRMKSCFLTGKLTLNGWKFLQWMKWLVTGTGFLDREEIMRKSGGLLYVLQDGCRLSRYHYIL